MSEYLPEVYRVLDLAEKYALEADVPGELIDALMFSVADKLVKIQHVDYVINEIQGRKSPTRTVLPGDRKSPLRLLLQDKGRSALTLHRMTKGIEPTEEKPIENGEKVEPEDVPAEFREGGEPGGKVLTTTYVIKNDDWYFKRSKQFTDAFEDGKLTFRIQVGRPYAYLYTELSAMSREDSFNAPDPSPEEIKARRLAIQATWPDHDHKGLRNVE